MHKLYIVLFSTSVEESLNVNEAVNIITDGVNKTYAPILDVSNYSREELKEMIAGTYDNIQKIKAKTISKSFSGEQDA